jgi:hypothetical protein
MLETDPLMKGRLASSKQRPDDRPESPFASGVVAGAPVHAAAGWALKPQW